MIASFVMTFLTNKDRPYLWVFYRFLDMAKEYNWPIIAQEEYFEKPSVLKKMGKRELLDAERVKRQFGYNVPSDDDLDKIEKFIIPKEFIEELRRDYGSNNDMFVGLLKKRNDKLESLLESFFSEMERKEEVECILALTSFPSLDYVANKHGTKVIKIELGALRTPTYFDTAFFDEHDILGNNSVEERFLRFQKELDGDVDKPLLLDRKEILAVMFEDKYLRYIFKLDQKPKYELGIALGTATWLPYIRNSQINDEELLWLAEQKYSKNDILMRKHPGDFAGARYPQFEYCLDTSVNTIEFILKCKRIATLGSNLSFESKLLGKETAVFQKSSGYYMSAHNLDDRVLTPELFINFFVFGYLIPMEMMTDPTYIRWRLDCPSEIEIYNKHMSFYFLKRGIEKDKWNLSHSLLDQILKQRGFNYDTKDDFSDIVRPHIPTLSDYKKKIDQLEKRIEELEEGNESTRCNSGTI